MKRLTLFAAGLAFLLLITSTSHAQKNDKELDKYLDELVEQHKEAQKKAEEAQRDAIAKEALDLLQKEVLVRIIAPEIEQINKKLQAYNSSQTSSKPVAVTPKGQKGEFDFIPLFSIPAPASDLASAYGTAGLKNKTSTYDNHAQLIERKAKELAELAQRNDKIQDVYQREGVAGIEKEYRQEADKNPMIQQMGGTDKIAKMSESERKAAALQAANNMMSNPAAVMGGNNNPAMNKLMQDMMQNPELAKKFEKMSPAEKEVFMKKYFADSAPRNDAQFDKTMKERNDNAYAMEVMQTIQRMEEAMMAAANRYGQRMQFFETAREQSMNKLRNWALAKCEALPIINGGSGVGQTKDQAVLAGIQKVLEAAQLKWAAAAITYNRNQWGSYREEAIGSIQEFNAFYGNYEYGKRMKNVNAFSGAYVEPQIAGAANRVLSVIHQLTEKAKDITVQGRDAYDHANESRKTLTLYMCEGS